jgi:DNA repair photolyase
MASAPSRLRGRGALSQPAPRFESTARERIDDGWYAEPEPDSIATTITAEKARTIISRNDSPDISFDRSINPYRGCEHGCIYCLAGDTPILMADGTTRLLANVKADDEIYGTERVGWCRRYTRTRVLAHWSVIKPAYRLTLEDGTSVVSGADHRFLTERGWKYVTGAHADGARRPRLTLSNKLMGTGAFAATPARGTDYRLGYLCGMIREDGMLGEWHYLRAGRTHGDQYRFRLALCDVDALERARKYLREFMVDTQSFVFAHARPGYRAVHALRTSARANVDATRHLITWPDSPSIEWFHGYLAGIFDAEGSYSAGILRISNTNGEIIGWICRALAACGFRHALEHVAHERRKSITVVRLLGGLREYLRFFLCADPAIARKRGIAGQAVKSAAKLKVVSIEGLGKALRLYDITTGTGDFIANGLVSHNCYARPAHAYMDLSPGLDFETRLFYKPEAAQLLDRELRKPGYVCQPMHIGGNTDPYQPIERKLKVTRAVLETLLRFRHATTLITKGATLMLRDLDLFSEFARLNLISIAVSITSLDDSLKRTLEPRTSSPGARLKLIAELTSRGIPTTVMAAPLIPFINDAEIERILEAAAAAGATGAHYVMLRLPLEINGLFREWLQTHHPLKADHVMSLVQQMRGGKDYDSRWGVRQKGTGDYASLIARRFALACRRLGLNEQHHRRLDTSAFRVPPAAGDQLALI